MNKQKLYNYFQSSFDLVPSTQGWYRLNNPFEVKKGMTMAVNFGFNRIICHRTGYKSSITDFLRILTNKDSREIFSMIEKYTEVEFKITIPLNYSKATVKLPDNFYLFDEEATLQKRASSYLMNRNLDIDLLRERSIGFCNDGDWFGRIIIPFMNPTLQYYIGRDFIGQNPKYKNPKKEDVGIGKSEIFYNEEALRGDKVYLCEGVFDALTCGEKGIASLGWKLSATQFSKLCHSPCDIYIVPDKGFFQKALITAKELLVDNDVFITNLDNQSFGDINEIGSIENLKFKQVKWTTTN